MRAPNSRWLWITSASYLLVGAAIGWARWPELSLLDLNELGDLLAGVFSPLAFLWLVGGYLQQGQELRQNTEALLMQAAELKNSVEQQAELVRVARKQLEAEQERFLLLTQPRFGVAFIERSQPYGSSLPAFMIGLINHGARAVRVHATLNIDDEHFAYEIDAIEPLGEWKIPLQVLPQFQATTNILLRVSCEAATATLKPAEFHLKLSKGADGFWALKVERGSQSIQETVAS